VFDLRIFQSELNQMGMPTAEFQALLSQQQSLIQQPNLDVEGTTGQG